MMNRNIIYKTGFLVIILLCVSFYADAFYTPTHTYSAKVQSKLSSSSTGGGLIYISQDQNSEITVPSNKWATECEGGNSCETENENLPVFLYAKANDGYKFDGWADSDTDTPANAVSPYVRYYQVGNNNYGAYYTHPYREKTYSIYAFFSPIPYAVSFLPGEHGTGSMSSTTYKIDGSGPTTEAPACTFTPETGYEFDRWKVTSAGGNWTINQEIAAGYTFPTNTSGGTGAFGDITLTALWKPIEYTITYDTQGGSFTSTPPNKYTIEDALTLPALTKDGGIFGGWMVTIANGNWTSGDIIQAGTLAAGKYGNITLTGQWTTSITITISGLESGANAIFNVTGPNGFATTVATGSSVTITRLIPGSYTVTPVNSWTWTRESMTAQTQTVTSSGYTFTFSATGKTGTKRHDEDMVVF